MKKLTDRRRTPSDGNTSHDPLGVRWAKNCLFRTRPTVRKCCDSKYFLGDLRRLFFLVTGNRDRKFRYCSRIYVRKWFTLLNEQNPLLDFEVTRFVNELWKKKKNPSTYRPIGEMEGRVQEMNILLRVA